MKIQLKRSGVLDGAAAKKPSAEQMEYGELAVNYNNGDPAVFLKDSNDTIIRIAGKGAKGLDGDYVNITGDDMTGDLTLGTDKIVLDASGGSITAAGGLATIDKWGQINVNTPASTGYAFQSRILDGDATCVIAGDGSITADGDLTLNGTGNGEVFISANTNGAGGYYRQKLDAGAAGGIWRIMDSSGSDKVTINADGSTTFAGTVVSFNDATVNTGNGITLEGGIGEISARRTADPTNYLFSGYNTVDNSRVASIASNGSATFKSNVDAYGYVSKGNSSTTNIWTGYHIDGVTNPITSTIKADGSAIFTGNITAVSAEFTGGVRVNNPSGVASVNLLRLGNVNNSGSKSAHLFLANGYYVNPSSVDGTGAAAKILPDGSATFGNYTDNNGNIALNPWGNIALRRDSIGPVFEVYTGGNANSDKTITINQDGSATFAGDQVSIASNANVTIGKNGAANNASLNLIAGTSPAAASYSLLTGVQSDGTSLAFNLKADGSAAFSGTITANGYSMASLAQL